MINNQLMEKEQIPVQIGQKTYFGCCEMCREKLERDEEARAAIDPVSRKRVDKALAVVGALPSGEVRYFETEENLRAYARR